MLLLFVLVVLLADAAPALVEFTIDLTKRLGDWLVEDCDTTTPVFNGSTPVGVELETAPLVSPVDVVGGVGGCPTLADIG